MGSEGVREDFECPVLKDGATLNVAPPPKAGSGQSRTARRAIPTLLGILLTGCSTINAIKAQPDTQKPLALTAAEAESMRADGFALYEQQPRELGRVAKAARMLEQAARALPDRYDAHVQAAQALSYVSDAEKSAKQKKSAAERGIVLARHARELKPADAAGHYWYAINVGLLADVDRSYGLSAVGEMESALRRAIELDEKYDYAGPLRILGILHLRAPPPPMSIGSNRKGLRELERAAALFPDYPETYLYLAEAQQTLGKLDEAQASVHKVLAAPPWPDRVAETRQWQIAARQLQDKWRKAP